MSLIILTAPVGHNEEALMISPWQDRAKEAVVSVGGGRGFVLRMRDENRIITAAHCLPQIPPDCADVYERTHRCVGPLGGEPSIFAECLFVDPVADIAVLGCPDGEELENADFEWRDFIGKGGTLDVSALMDESPVRAWLLSLNGEWNPCSVRPSLNGVMLWIEQANGGIHLGMSGSPIVTDEGKVVGLVSRARGAVDLCTEGGPSPRIQKNLPLWLVEQL